METTELLQTALRAAVIYVSVLLVVRISGKRAIGNITAFDLLVALIIGEIVDEPIFGDVPMIQALLAMIVIAGLHYLDSYLSYRSPKFDRLVGGVPHTLIKDGRLSRTAMAQERINEEELLSLLRQQGVEHIEEVKRGTLEMDGALSVSRLRRHENFRPATPGVCSKHPPDTCTTVPEMASIRRLHTEVANLTHAAAGIVWLISRGAPAAPITACRGPISLGAGV